MCAGWVGNEGVDINYHSGLRSCQGLQSNAVIKIYSQSLVFKKILRDQILEKVTVHRDWLGKNILIKETTENLYNSPLESGRKPASSPKI